jgi:hypothetical protein
MMILALHSMFVLCSSPPLKWGIDDIADYNGGNTIAFVDRQPSALGTSAQGLGPHQPLNAVQATGNAVGHTGKLELARASIKL